MREYAGDPECPIWLIGDSPPEAWVDRLATPLDPRHPARHNDLEKPRVIPDG